MATNPAPAGRTKYCPVNEAPEPGSIKERSPTDYESPQLSTMKYRPNYTPGSESTYYDGEQLPKRDTRQSAGNV